MLFNSAPFLFFYLPLTLAVFFMLGRRNTVWAAAWLALASLFFYGWWNPKYVALLLLSMVFNYRMGMAIVRATARRGLLIFAIGCNLALLAYYKYANFFVDNINALSGAQWTLGEIILPLGISFFTFTQIAYLVDAAQGKAREARFVHYALFVTWFPHLIAGPILHHAEMMPQFARREPYSLDAANIAAGLTLLVLGLAKKVLIADGVGGYSAPFFDAARAGSALTFTEAWCGALAYTFQLYFDFSAYSDMAVGLSLMFGIKLPVNFNSPYKALNIIDFWRRWHITLSRFLRDYLYVPLGGNRKGAARRYLNLFLTMLLGGLWHGAGWTFIAWGAMHGAYLIINHAWHALCGPYVMNRWLARTLTFIAVVAGWVVFRADNMDAALLMLKGMAGLHGFTLPDHWLAKWGALGAWLSGMGVTFSDARGLVTAGLIYWIVILLALAWLAPNTQEIMDRARPVLDAQVSDVQRWWMWRPAPWVAVPLAMLALLVVVNLHKKSEFLYFQF
jgi:D-alanyl-lipoteichoic acid acyltransferase DltB (MBOAT superfamily)